ncbi:cutinase family protein [Mycobacterium sp. WUMAC-067]|uniref:cutinase family protein n=1 Tax=unclassified Mycobacterium TaxID=2642494 RepID=UPI001CDA3BEC|nr:MULTISPECIES: cutinase family protein [unclassified Mycobacterium]MCA2245381.1 cutinase family protein [Mycobacterium sp. WUMAC-067]MCA2315745.1 cutinase family protein [Mycobacterium sp. WUMAC-025]
MSSLRSIRFLATAVATASAALLSAPVPAASAEPCPDVDVVFARGTGEPPGVGGVGQAFVDALRSRVGGKSVGVSPVNYEASGDFNGGIAFARTFVDGIKDAGGHIESTASNCPNTKTVLGGYSQGAAVAGFVTSPAVPKEVPQEFVSYVPQPLPRAVADHVAAVVLFGTPSNEFLRGAGAPPITIGPLYANKTIQLCATDDTICNGAPPGPPGIAHTMYAANGMVDQGADFAAQRL